MDHTAVKRSLGGSTREVDPWLNTLLEREEQRQFRQICLAAASSLCPLAVREAQASVFSNIDAEGYPPKRMAQIGLEHLLDLDEQVAYYQRYGDTRYNKGTELANVVEIVAQRRAAEALSTEWAHNSDISVKASDISVNLQCPTGSLANTAVFEALLKPGDVVLSMNLVDGGHLTHGSPLHRSGKTYKIVHYGVDPATQQLDYEQIRELVHQHRPKLIVGGASSYPWAIDWKRFREAAEVIEPRPYILADISHPVGLVIAGLIPNPIGYADVVTFTTYKTLCGPRGAAILSTDAAIAESIDRAVFPGLQSAPVFQQIVALAVAFKIAKTQAFTLLQHKIAENARLLSQHLLSLGIPIAFGGTNTHIVVADVGKVPTSTEHRLSGDVVARILERVGISCNSNLIPGDKYAPLASGIRLGSTWISQLGYGETEVGEIAAIIADVCKGIKPFLFYGPRRETLGGKVREELLQATSSRVRDLLQKSGEYIPDTPPENSRSVRNYADFHKTPPDKDRDNIEVWDLKKWTEALIITGERATGFLQSILTLNMFDLKEGDVFSALVLNANGEKRLNVLVCSLASETQPRFLLVYRRSPENNFRDWLHMLSDGYVEIEKDDPYLMLDGPVVIKSADAKDLASANMGEVLLAGDEVDNILDKTFGAGADIEAESFITGTKPYFIGQTGLPRAASSHKKEFSFEKTHTTANPSQLSPLYGCYRALGATFTDFAGYQMPQYYTSSGQEHSHVRKNAGLFDLSYKVLLGLRGNGAERFLDLVLTESIPPLSPGGSFRSCILSPEGTVIGDCILYRLAFDYFIMELEPVSAQVAESWLRAVADREVIIDPARPGVEVDRSCSISNLRTSADPLMTLALQGPKSTTILSSLLKGHQSRSVLNNFRKGQIREFSFAGFTGWIARRGSTGEPVGYEIFVPQSKAEFLWNALMNAGLDHSLEAIGVSAADSLRIEAGLPLYGKELGGAYAISPMEAGFGSSVKLHKPFFIGRQKMLFPLSARRIVRLRAEIDDRRLGKLEPTLHDASGKVIGVTTSTACISGQFYGLGLLDEGVFDEGRVYVSYDGSPGLVVEVLSIPYSAVVEA